MSDSGMSKIVKTVTSICFPFVLIYGLYIIVHGHITPGGGFQGGAIVASACAMILIAHGSVWTMGKIKEKHLSIFESLGALGFITLAGLGLFFGVNYFFNNFLINQEAIPIFNKIGEGTSNINTAGVKNNDDFSDTLYCSSRVDHTWPLRGAFQKKSYQNNNRDHSYPEWCKPVFNNH